MEVVGHRGHRLVRVWVEGWMEGVGHRLVRVWVEGWMEGVSHSVWYIEQWCGDSFQDWCR